MRKNLYALIAFKSTHAAMASQKILSGIKFQVCPILRIISAGCGISLRINEKDVTICKEKLANGGLKEEMYTFYLIYDEDGTTKFELI